MLASARIKRFFRAALKAIPILGALGVSLWTLFLYFSHDRQLKQLEFQRLTESRFTVVDPSFSLRRYSTDPELSDLYLATFAVTLQNSAAEPVEISASIVDIWHGRLGAAPTEDRASAINLPAHRWDATPRQGDVDWTLIHTSAFQVASSQSYSFLPANTEVAWSGGGVGRLRQGQSSVYQQHVLVRAKEEDLIGVTYSFAVNGGESMEDLWHATLTGWVTNAEPPAHSDEVRKPESRLTLPSDQGSSHSDPASPTTHQ
jgi:hypothetical protein